MKYILVIYVWCFLLLLHEKEVLCEKYNLLIFYSNISRLSSNLRNTNYEDEDIKDYSQRALHFGISSDHIHSTLIRRQPIVDVLNQNREDKSAIYNVFDLISNPTYFVVFIEADGTDGEDMDKIKVSSEVFTLPRYKIGVINCLALRPKGTELNLEQLEAIRDEALRLDSLETDVVIAIGRNLNLREDIDEIDLVFNGDGNFKVRNSENVRIMKDVWYEFPESLRLVEMKLVPLPMMDDSSESGNVLLRDTRLVKAMEVGVVEILAKLDNRCMRKECSFGNMITDAMVFYGKAELTPYDLKRWSNYPIALYMDKIKRSISKGNVSVTVFDETVLKNDRIVQTRVFGRELEHALTNDKNQNARIQVSGIRVTRIADSDLFVITTMCGHCAMPRFDLLDTTKKYDVLMNHKLAGELNAKVVPGAEVMDVISIVRLYVSALKVILPTEEDRYEEAADERIFMKLDRAARQSSDVSRVNAYFDCILLINAVLVALIKIILNLLYFA